MITSIPWPESEELRNQINAFFGPNGSKRQQIAYKRLLQCPSTFRLSSKDSKRF